MRGVVACLTNGCEVGVVGSLWLVGGGDGDSFSVFFRRSMVLGVVVGPGDSRHVLSCLIVKGRFRAWLEPRHASSVGRWTTGPLRAGR